MIGCVRFLTKDADDPSLHHHAQELREKYLPQREMQLDDEKRLDRDAAMEAMLRAKGFADQLQEEIDGRL